MITSSEKQSDKEIETSFVHLMQMPDVHVCRKGMAEVKMHIDQIYSQQKATQMLRREHSAPGGHLPSTNVWHPHKISSQMPW